MRFETLLVPLDFSPHADRALAAALELAVALGAKRVHLLHVHHPPPMPTPLPGSGPSYVEIESRLIEDAGRALQSRVDRVGKMSFALEISVEVGVPAEVICSEAEKRAADLIVMGTHGRTGVAHVLLGSVAERTVARAPCPVLTVRARDAS
ncbi:MAG: universal stress protein [Myxococcales bacterium]|nr:universal stress protein [Myxococcales bacterium]MDH5307452.1 universal stress protein [Myxococcales bacterium]MDH5565407.1 universal stress protein [Myxococcales bacterium]